MTSRVVEPTVEEMRRRREELLRRARTDYEDLADRAEHDELVGNEWWIWDELEAIDYLLAARRLRGNGDESGS